METTIAGMKTTPVEKNKFIELLTGLMETIEEVCNGGKNTEGNYLLLMNDLKTLYNMKEQINNTQVYQAITRATPAPRQTHLNLQQKLQSKAYFKCEKCETVTQTKNKQRHYASELCQITYQTKCSGVVVKEKQHKWYAIQQVLTSCFRNRKQREPEFAAGICFLEPEKTCVCCNEKKFNIYPYHGEAYNTIVDSNGKLSLLLTGKSNLPFECNECCKTRLKKEENDIKLAKEEKRLKNKEIKLAREQKKLAKEEAKEEAELNEMASNDINQAVKAVIKKKRVIKKKPVRKLVIEEEEEVSSGGEEEYTTLTEKNDKFIVELKALQEQIQGLFPPSYKPQPNMTKKELTKTLTELTNKIYEIVNQKGGFRDTEEELQKYRPFNEDYVPFSLSYNVRGMVVHLM